MNIVTTANKEQLDVVMSFAQQGDYQQALLKGNLLMRQFPLDPIVPNLVGTLYQASGKGEAAIISFKQAIKLKPDFYQAYYNMGISLKDSDRHQEAIDANKKAIKLKPDYLAAYANMGVSLHATEKFDEAILSYEKSIELSPNFYHVHENLADTLMVLRRYEDAVVCYVKAIKLQPDNALASFKLGEALGRLKKYDAAIGSFMKGLNIDKDNTGAKIDLGYMYVEKFCYPEATKIFEEVIKLEPHNLNAHKACGETYFRAMQYDKALVILESAINIKKDDPIILETLGLVLYKKGLFKKAADSLLKSIKFDPEHSPPYIHLGNVYFYLKLYNEALDLFKKGIRLQPECIDNYLPTFGCLSYIRVMEVIKQSKLDVVQNELFQIYNEQLSRIREFTLSNYNTNPSSKKIRIGFVSGDLGRHPVGYFLKQLFEHIDKNTFELVAFSNKPDDEYSDTLKSFTTGWHYIYDLDDGQAAHLIHEKSIDVLIDLSGHTVLNRVSLFSYKPAPVQATWLGYWDTTGLNEMDYVIGDPYLFPKEIHENYTEEVVLLEDCWVCFGPPKFDIPVIQTPAIKNKYITFGCFQRLEKVTTEATIIWSKILSQVAGSKIIFKVPREIIDIKNTIIDDLSENGIEADRVIFLDYSLNQKYYESYQNVDIVLDTFPYPGLTGGCDALWMGVPIVTMRGKNALSNLGYTLAVNSGHSDLCATNDSEYIDIAVKLAQDVNKLNEDRLNRREKILKSNLCNGPQFAKNFEKLMKEIISKERNV
tara:strand:+ start:106910 stop:109204 length:2295 start_codon:yes stop_codon:yes gene_type:complete